MKRYLQTGALTLALAFASTDVSAQGLLPFSAEVRGAAAFPTGDFGDAAETGAGFEVNAKLSILPLVAAYVGYDWFEFGVDDGGFGNDLDLNATDSGFAFGAQLGIPTLTGFSPWVRAGAIYNQMEIEGNVSGIGGSVESERSLGWEIGAGISFPLGMVLSVTPGVRYRQYSHDSDLLRATFGDDVSYFTAGIGLSASF